MMTQKELLKNLFQDLKIVSINYNGWQQIEQIFGAYQAAIDEQESKQAEGDND